MEENELDKLIRDEMSLDNFDPANPDLLLVFEARQAVLARAKSNLRHSLFCPPQISDFLRYCLRPFQMGLSVAMMVAGLFLTNLYTGDDHGSTMSGDSHVSLSAGNNTISVISSTMLTSIPTLRN